MDIDIFAGCQNYVGDDNTDDALIPVCNDRACNKCIYGRNKPPEINKQLLEQVLKLEP